MKKFVLLFLLFLVIPVVAQNRYEVLLNMVHHNPGEPIFSSRYSDPNFIAMLGYTGQVQKMEVQCGVTFDLWEKNVVPQRTEERFWIERHAASIRTFLRRIKDAGLEVSPFIDMLVLPQSVMEKFGDEIKNEKGQISVLKPLTQELIREQINELFWRFPDLDGLVIRHGETYLHDTPYHKGGAPARTASEHALLINLLREEVCVKRNKKLYYRTWDFDNLHVRPDVYLEVTNQIKPHPNLYMSIKHVNSDYLRGYPFNKTIGLGKIQQIVEISMNQAGCYGKNAHPYYIGKGIIDGWNDMKPEEKKGIKDLLKVPLVKGFWIWTWGDGWFGPYFDNEFWIKLNEYVIREYVRNPLRSEEELFFEYTNEKLNISNEDAHKLRKLCLMSEDAVFYGQDTQLLGRYNWWIRDNFLSGINLKEVVQKGNKKLVLEEKLNNLKRWYQMEEIAKDIHLSTSEDQEFLEVSTTYGRIKYEIVYQIWRIQIMLAEYEVNKSSIDRNDLVDAIRMYEKKWDEWVDLKNMHPCCPTLYEDWRSVNVKPPFQKNLQKLKTLIDFN